MADGRSFSTTCDSELERAVRAKVKAEKKREGEWWTDALAEVHEIKDPAARRDARAALEAERLRRRYSGECPASRDALLAYHLEKVLAENGWNRKYKPIPVGKASIPGRRVGVELASGRAGDGQGRLACNLPRQLWEQVRRAAYWESQPAERELQAWADRFGDGLGAADRIGGPEGLAIAMSLAFGKGPRQEDMARRRELRGKIITTGDILRAAAERATRG
ncbi:hypothetical protein [Amycolatopsis keratiniphila]|uniref:Uncharacterized protein n=1 Tax=Amycolatopsis keratiniphila subsp. keratiniphila TaxID=227715 RepID=A0A1W2M207_9PSEU|nr:hypothetical protein [Amycolatopsis keratiniphila]ONF73923.1 hypothetical protein AVR91_0204115 [Amycolatopsis keratiniphila subsp. keratiniphila]